MAFVGWLALTNISQRIWVPGHMPGDMGPRPVARETELLTVSGSTTAGPGNRHSGIAGPPPLGSRITYLGGKVLHYFSALTTHRSYSVGSSLLSEVIRTGPRHPPNVGLSPRVTVPDFVSHPVAFSGHFTLIRSRICLCDLIFATGQAPSLFTYVYWYGSCHARARACMPKYQCTPSSEREKNLCSRTPPPCTLHTRLETASGKVKSVTMGGDTYCNVFGSSLGSGRSARPCSNNRAICNLLTFFIARCKIRAMKKHQPLITPARYLGKICIKHVEAAGARYKCSGACVSCVAAARYRWAKKNPDTMKRINDLARSKARVRRSYAEAANNKAAENEV